MNQMNNDLINKISAEIVGKEREIVEEFCKAYLAGCKLNGLSFKEIAESVVLNIQHDFNKGMATTRYWFEFKK